MTTTRAKSGLLFLLGVLVVVVFLATQQMKTSDRDSKTVSASIVLSNKYEAANEWVRIVRFSERGEYLATVADSIRIWRVSDGGLLQTLDRHQGSIQGIDFSPDGEFLLSGSIDMTIRLWRVSDGALISTIEIPSQITSEVSAPEMTSSGNSVPPPMAVMSVAYSPDGKILAAGIEKGKVILWDAASLELLQVLDLNTDLTVNSLDFSPDSNLLAAGTSAGGVEIWDPVLGNQVAVLYMDQVVWSVQFSTQGRQVLATANDAQVRILDINGQLQHTFVGGAPIGNAQFLLEQEIIVAADDFGSLFVWNVENGELIFSRDDLGAVIGLDYDFENKLLATTGPDKGYVSLWSVFISVDD